LYDFPKNIGNAQISSVVVTGSTSNRSWCQQNIPGSSYVSRTLWVETTGPVPCFRSLFCV
jgi:hypothetical protein